MRRKARRLRFEHWLLLAIRTLLIVLVVLAVAEPSWETTGAVLSRGGQTHRTLVIDGSYSMGYRPADKSRFDEAKQLARRIIEESPQGDAFTLVLMSAPPRVVVGQRRPWSPPKCLKEIDNLQTGTNFHRSARNGPGRWAGYRQCPPRSTAPAAARGNSIKMKTRLQFHQKMRWLYLFLFPCT